ncbi:ACT domain-containing protein [Thalassotalea litorea]|uniref:ACT domain-containing protein n=1 Tax=Thalassotalea litorea TaxID=2020715 RepID=A0A5R9IQD1_9GAMM|nr:ACT domain-containing protein [Thalassotalea litorea]TLU64098.1 ACT domain-containing protein [Thalassotalea litorea]
MNAITDLNQLIASMKPELQDGSYVFTTVSGDIKEHLALNPLACFQESEGLTLILEQVQAERANITYEGVFKQITLTVHSSLEAVGLTAAIATALAEQGISANVVAAHFHDHIFVPEEKATKAIRALAALSESV